ADATPLARMRAGARGAPIEYNIDVIPAAARAALVKMGVAAVAHVAAEPETRAEAQWRWFAGQSDSVKAAAEHRMIVVAMIESFRAAGMTRTAAIASAAAHHGDGVSTIEEWLELIRGVADCDRLAFIAPQRGGGAPKADVDPEIWELLKSDFLRPEQPSFSSCYKRVRDLHAKPRGLTLPHERTLFRKLEREVPRQVIVSCREGAEALRRTIPAQNRTVAGLHAMELVNIDGHEWDVWVMWPGDKVPVRPVMVAIQDVYSRKYLAWSVGKTESVIETRLAFAHLFERYGIPKACLMDNGRAFASKQISGGMPTRFRFKVREEEPLGLLASLNIANHWAKPRRGQSKPIERGFGEFARVVAKHPAFAGAWTGNRPDAKPENYRSKAVPIDKFIEIVESEIARHNAQPGRQTEMAKADGRSLDEVFAESYATAPIGRADPELLRRALLAVDNRPTDRNNGSITLHGNQYWTEALSAIAGDRVTVRFDPDDLHAPIHVYDAKGAFLCTAPVWSAVGFLDVAGAKARSRQEKDVRKKTKALVDAENLLDAARVADRYTPVSPVTAPEPGATRLIHPRGTTAAALKPTAQRVPRAAQEAAQREALRDQRAGLKLLNGGRN
ncbi:transposase domain-containing protein, partial [Sphingomonas sp. AOB5]|uniref:transposase domain-containing protein n=1 Tax=Sphingomonas sp. AOB5 TaxID=3034017 RepID=UPI0023F99165